jgi:hypothetical protein
MGLGEEATMTTQKKCGSSLYVFTNSATHNPTCVIDSHGFRPPSKSYFTVPNGMTVKFYVNPHAFLLVDEEVTHKGAGGVVYNYAKCMDDIASGRDNKRGQNVDSVKDYTGGNSCPNYLLSKQVKGSGKDKITPRYDSIDYQSLLTYVERKIGTHPVDIVSVRNRFGKFVYLEDVLKSFQKHGFNYTEIRCSFCRGGTVDAFKDMFGRKTVSELAGGR